MDVLVGGGVGLNNFVQTRTNLLLWAKDCFLSSCLPSGCLSHHKLLWGHLPFILGSSYFIVGCLVYLTLICLKSSSGVGYLKSSSINEMNLIIKWVCQCVCGGAYMHWAGGVAVNNSNNQIHYVVFQSQMLLYSVYMAYLTDKLIGSKPNKEKKH